MKKTFTLLSLLLISIVGFSQTTYYWVGGVGPTSFTSNSNWNTQLDGLGDARSVAGEQYTDILVFDGSNIGGATATTGNVYATCSSDTVGRIIFTNNANVQLGRSGAGSANINIQGDGTALDDLVIGSGCVVTLGGELYNYDVRILLGLPTVPTIATGSVAGDLYLSPLSTSVHTASYITARTTNGLQFEAGSNCYVTDSTSASPFNGSANTSVLFKTGSSLHYFTGRSPFGNSSAIQFANFEQGSNFYVKGTNRSYLDGVTVYASSSWVNAKSFANISIQNGASLIADGTIYRIDTLTINNGCSFTTHTSGHTPVLGDLTVNGTFTFPSGSNTLVMGGNVPQSISGSGTIDIPNFVVADYSSVTLNKTIAVTSAINIAGDINFGTSGQLTGVASFTSRVASTVVAGTATTVAGSYLITYSAPSGITGYSITGAGIPANTNVIGFGTSANTVYLSKPATASAAGVAVSFTTDTATLQTANVTGFNVATGSVISSGILSFQSGTNYIIDAATSSPFGISTGVGTSITLGNLSVNAPVTTNYNIRLTGNLNLGAGILTIRAQDTLRLLNNGAITGAPFSASKYIRTSISGANVAVLRIDNLTATLRMFPVGTATEYLPVMLTPTSVMDYAVSVFQGVTSDGTPSGTPFTTTEKENVVDAVWTIDRVNGTGDCQVQLNWVSALEGVLFSALNNADLGISRYDGAIYQPAIGIGDNSANTAFANFSNFSPFIVTKNAGVVPVQLKSIAATQKAAGIEVSWQVVNEDGIATYEVEKSTDRITFRTIGMLNGTNSTGYSFTDTEASKGIVYYRLKIISIAGDIKYSSIVIVRISGNNKIQLYPNPVADMVTFTGLSSNTIIRISNADGKILLTQKTNALTQSIDISAFTKGSYIAEILVEGIRVSTQRFSKQ